MVIFYFALSYMNHFHVWPAFIIMTKNTWVWLSTGNTPRLLKPLYLNLVFRSKLDVVLVPAVTGRRREYTSDKSAVHLRADMLRQTSTLTCTPTCKSESLINLTCTFLDCRKKSRRPWENMHTAHRKALTHGIKCRTFLLWCSSAFPLARQKDFRLKFNKVI